MNKKEISELRRRFKPEKNNISQVHGCYVNGKGEVISYIDESLRTMPQEEAEKYLSLLGKALSGTPGKNLIDIVFSTAQVVDSDEHRRLTGTPSYRTGRPARRSTRRLLIPWTWGTATT